MNLEYDFKQLNELITPYKFKDGISKLTVKDYKVLIDRLWSVIIGMIMSNEYTSKQIKELIKKLK